MAPTPAESTLLAAAGTSQAHQLVRKAKVVRITALLCFRSLGQAVAPFAGVALVEGGGMRLGPQLTPLCSLLAAAFIGFAIARHSAARENSS